MRSQEQMWHEVIVQSQLLKSKLHAVLGQIATKHSLTTHQMLLLMAIHKCEVMTVGDISKTLEIFQANASALCKRMESLGFIDRVRNQEDVRVVNIQLTSQGESIVELVKKEMSERMSQVSSEIVSVKAIQAGLEELNKVIQIMEGTLYEKIG